MSGQPPLPGQQLHSRLVYVIQVGALFAVYLYVHEVFVHQSGYLLVLKGFALHNVAPVASGVAYGQQNGPVLDPGPVKRFRTPGVPIHRVMGVLKQVRAGFLDQTVGRLVIHGSPSGLG